MEIQLDVLSEFYEVKREVFSSGEGEVERDLVYVKNTSDLIMHVLEERGLDPHKAIIRINVDAGQGFLKVVLNVFDPSDKAETPGRENSGVKRSLILALVENVPEQNSNLSRVLEPLQLQDIDYKISFDLKCGNAMFGLSAHSGKYACLWCEGPCTLESGEKRTFSSIDENYERYSADGHVSKNMQYYKNCIYPRLLYREEPGSTLVEDFVPLPELHLFIGIMTLFLKVLLNLWPDIESWFKDNYIQIRGFHGIGLDGNNAQRFLEKLKFLDLHIRSNAELNPKLEKLLPILQCIRHFSDIKSQSFSSDIGEDLELSVKNFKESFLKLQNSLWTDFCYELKPSWKVHIVVCHLVPFLRSQKYGLGVFSEQAGESTHHHHGKIWKRFKRRIEHSDYPSMLKKSVVVFGANNV